MEDGGKNSSKEAATTSPGGNNHGQCSKFILQHLFMFKVTGQRSKGVAPGSDHDAAQLDHVRNICANFRHLLRWLNSDISNLG